MNLFGPIFSLALILYPLGLPAKGLPVKVLPPGILNQGCAQREELSGYHWVMVPGDVSGAKKLRGHKNIYRGDQLTRIEWMDVEVQDNGRLITTFAIENRQVVVTAFSAIGETCKKISSKTKWQNRPQVTTSLRFTEQDLINEINSSRSNSNLKGTVIYLWSPSMPYSAQNLLAFKKWTESNRHKFLPLLSQDADEANAKAYWRKLGEKLESLKQTDSHSLNLAAGPTHFPLIFYIGAGDWSHVPLVGVTTQQEFQDFLFARHMELHNARKD